MRGASGIPSQAGGEPCAELTQEHRCFAKQPMLPPSVCVSALSRFSETVPPLREALGGPKEAVLLHAPPGFANNAVHLLHLLELVELRGTNLS